MLRHNNGGDAEAVGQGAGVLCGGASEGQQRVSAWVEAALDADTAHGGGHAFVGDLEQAAEGLIVGDAPTRGAIDFIEKGGERAAGGVGVDGYLESRRVEAAEEEVDVGDGQWSAGSVTGGAGRGAGAVGADAEGEAVEPADRASACGNGFDGQRVGGDAGVADGVFADDFESAVAAGDVGAGSAHVHGDDGKGAGLFAEGRSADDAAGWAGEETLAGAKLAPVDERAGAGHNEEAASGEGGAEARKVGLDDGRERCVDQRGLGAGEEALEGAKPAGEGDVGEADLAQDLPHCFLMCGIEPGVQQGDGGVGDARVGDTAGVLCKRLRIGGSQNSPGGVETFFNFDDLGVERIGLCDAEGEKVGPALIADAQEVAEAARDKEGDGGAASLEEGVGPARGGEAHVDGREGPAGGRLRQEAGGEDGGLFAG